MADTLILLLGATTVVAWLGLEAYLWVTGRPLITHRIQAWNRTTGGLIGLLFGFFSGLLGAHFFFCP